MRTSIFENLHNTDGMTAEDFARLARQEKAENRREDWKEVVAAISAAADFTITTGILALQNLKIAIPTAIVITGLIFAVKYL